MNIVIVPAGPADAGDLAAVHVRAWRETYRGLLPADYLERMSVETYARRMRRQLTYPLAGDVILAASSAHGLVGYISGGGARRGVAADWEVSSFYLLRAAQGRGFGRRLLTGAARVFADLGAGSLAISVLRDNVRARSFYDHMGGAAQTPRQERGPGGLLMEVMYVWPDVTDLA